MTRRDKVVFGIGALVVGALTFLVASAYPIDRGLPRWLAGIVGALAFPVLPVAWHTIGERRRAARLAAAKFPARTSLDSGDRYVLRALAVAVVVIGPMIALGGFGVVRAAWNHKGWFVPAGSGSDSGGRAGSGSGSGSGRSLSQARLLAHVPDDAEAVIVVRDGDLPGEGVFAYGDGQLVVLAPEEPDSDRSIDETIGEINGHLDKVPFVTIAPVGKVKADGAAFALASERWRSRVGSPGAGPSAAIRTELERAPAGASVAIALVPAAARDRIYIEAGAAWMVASDDKIVVEGRIQSGDEAGADRLLAEASAAWKARRREVPKRCRGPVDSIADQVKVKRDGTTTTFHVEFAPQELMALMLCALES